MTSNGRRGFGRSSGDYGSERTRKRLTLDSECAGFWLLLPHLARRLREDSDYERARHRDSRGKDALRRSGAPMIPQSRFSHRENFSQAGVRESQACAPNGLPSPSYAISRERCIASSERAAAISCVLCSSVPAVSGKSKIAGARRCPIRHCASYSNEPRHTATSAHRGPNRSSSWYAIRDRAGVPAVSLRGLCGGRACFCDRARDSTPRSSVRSGPFIVRCGQRGPRDPPNRSSWPNRSQLTSTPRIAVAARRAGKTLII